MTGPARPEERRPKFPLADWLDDHEGVPHNLGTSGMRGELRSLGKILRAPRPASESEVRGLIADGHGVDPRRVFLTHGATEGNAVVLLALHRLFRRELGRSPRARFQYPEYPPLFEAARFVGFRLVGAGEAADLEVLSEPNNPTGLLRGAPEVERRRAGCVALLADETFRRFTDAPSLTRSSLPGAWVTGTLTKAFGADEVRLGWVIAPPGGEEILAPVVGQLTDGLAHASLAQAAALLRSSRQVLAETRAVFRANLRALRRRVPASPRLSAPVWFDRGDSGLPGDRLAKEALAVGVLVAPGSMFRDPTGVRVGLTHRSFPADLEAYLEVRARLTGSGSGRSRWRPRPSSRNAGPRSTPPPGC